MIVREPEIRTDIDRDRIRSIVTEALRMIRENFEGEHYWNDDTVLKELESILSSGRVSTQFFLSVGCYLIPDLKLRVDPQRKKVLCKSSFKKKAARINRFMRIL